MSSLGLAAPQALCPRCLLHNGFLLTRRHTPGPSLRCIGDGVGGWFHAQHKDGTRFTRRHYRSSPDKAGDKHKEVVTDSLQETLNLHRNINRRSLIRRVLTDNPNSGKALPGEFYPAEDSKPDLTVKAFKRPLMFSPEGSVEWESIVENNTLPPGEEASLKAFVAEMTEKESKVLKQGSKKSKSAQRRRERPLQSQQHPFDPDSPYRSFPGAGWGNCLGWKVKKGQKAQYPWMENLTAEQGERLDGFSRLNAEIEAFEKFIGSSPRETETSERVFSEATKLIVDKLGTSPPVCVGSRSTGMSLIHSDIDVIIPVRDPERPADGGRGPSATRPKAVRAHLDHLKQVEHILSTTGDYKHVSPIRARVPIVTAVHKWTGLELQFKCGDEGIGAPSSQEYMRNYQVEFPSLKAIYAVLRMSLEIRNLFGGIRHSIGTYGLSMMIVAALKLGDGTYRRDDLGRQLLHVLEVYSNFDFATYGIAVEPPSFFNKKASVKSKPTAIDIAEQDDEEYDPNEEAYLRGQRLISKMSIKRAEGKRNGDPCIQDPADYTNDLGICCHGTRKIQNVFRATLRSLKKGIEKWDEVPDDHDVIAAEDQQKSSSNPMLGVALGANYEALELARDKILYGSSYK